MSELSVNNNYVCMYVPMSLSMSVYVTLSVTMYIFGPSYLA